LPEIFVEQNINDAHLHQVQGILEFNKIHF